MKKKLSNILIILISAFAFTSCGDSKEDVAEDMIKHSEEAVKIMTSGDKDAIAKFTEAGKELEKRAKAAGIDLKDPSTYPENLKKAYEDLKSNTMDDLMKNLPEGTKDAAQEMINKALEEAKKK